MPFCTHCGSQVTASDLFCASCGSRQQRQTRTASDFLSNLSPRTASILCYIPVVGWVACVVVLAAQRFRGERTVRFHAFQGLYLFVAWLILDWGLMPFFFFDTSSFIRFSFSGIMKALIFGAWIFMLIKTSQNDDYRLPIFGDLADRSLAEQK
jgi:uncharacterized membrane protein